MRPQRLKLHPWVVGEASQHEWCSFGFSEARTMNQHCHEFTDVPVRPLLSNEVSSEAVSPDEGEVHEDSAKEQVLVRSRKPGSHVLRPLKGVEADEVVVGAEEVEGEEESGKMEVKG